jgi:hypothetical protein
MNNLKGFETEAGGPWERVDKQTSCLIVELGMAGEWYSWVDSNHRPPVPQTGALTN